MRVFGIFQFSGSVGKNHRSYISGNAWEPPEKPDKSWSEAHGRIAIRVPITQSAEVLIAELARA